MHRVSLTPFGHEPIPQSLPRRSSMGWQLQPASACCPPASKRPHPTHGIEPAALTPSAGPRTDGADSVAGPGRNSRRGGTPMGVRVPAASYGGRPSSGSVAAVGRVTPCGPCRGGGLRRGLGSRQERSGDRGGRSFKDSRGRPGFPRFPSRRGPIWPREEPSGAGGSGARCRTRTYDPVIKSHLLYQLS